MLGMAKAGYQNARSIKLSEQVIYKKTEIQDSKAKGMPQNKHHGIIFLF